MAFLAFLLAFGPLGLLRGGCFSSGFSVGSGFDQNTRIKSSLADVVWVSSACIVKSLKSRLTLGNTDATIISRGTDVNMHVQSHMMSTRSI